VKLNSLNKNTVISLTIALVVILYTISRFYTFLEGPSIRITSPSNGTTVNSRLLNISGSTTLISFITLNDRQIFIDQKGNLFEQLLLQDGYNIISIKATDRFGRKVEERLEVVYKP
jgi:hypothetical protein